MRFLYFLFPFPFSYQTTRSLFLPVQGQTLSWGTYPPQLPLFAFLQLPITPRHITVQSAPRTKLTLNYREWPNFLWTTEQSYRTSHVVIGTCKNCPKHKDTRLWIRKAAAEEIYPIELYGHQDSILSKPMVAWWTVWVDDICNICGGNMANNPKDVT